MTKDQTKSLESVLEHVDAGRRGFLGKLLAGTAAVAAVPAMTSLAFAQDGEGEGKGKGGKGKGGKGKGGEGKGGEGKGKGGEGKGKGGEGKGKGGRPDPAELAARLIEEHDKDGDGKLNKKELTAAIEQMMSRMGGRGKGGQGGGKGKGGGGRGGDGEGKGDRPRFDDDV